MTNGDYELGPEPDESELPEPEEPFEPEPAPEGPPPILIGGVALLAVVLLVSGFFLLRGCGAAEPQPPTPAPEVVATPAPEPLATPEPTPEPIELPALDDSDELVRRLAAALSAHPELAAWLAQPRLVRTFVVAVDNVAAGSSPARSLGFLKPSEPFSVERVRGGARLDPAGYARYDLVGAVAASLDAQGCARLYRQVEPLVDEAYAELGYPDKDFDATLRQAIDVLLAAPIVLERPPLERRVLAWRFTEPELEALPDAQKHLVRMGPENTRRIQAKLRELAAALGLEPS